MALYNLMRNYHNALCNDPEFEYDPARYYAVVKVNYKGKNMPVAIPLRSNINRKFQEQTDEVVSSVPSNKTRPGNMAGFHITKAIPICPALGVKKTSRNQRPDLQLVEQVLKIKGAELQKKVEKHFKRLEQGECIYGAINFGRALETMQRMAQQQTQSVKKEQSNQTAISAKRVWTNPTYQSTVAPNFVEVDEVACIEKNGSYTLKDARGVDCVLIKLALPNASFDTQKLQHLVPIDRIKTRIDKATGRMFITHADSGLLNGPLNFRIKKTNISSWQHKSRN